jgi:hypothetical protein
MTVSSIGHDSRPGLLNPLPVRGFGQCRVIVLPVRHEGVDQFMQQLVETRSDELSVIFSLGVVHSKGGLLYPGDPPVWNVPFEVDSRCERESELEV